MDDCEAVCSVVASLVSDFVLDKIEIELLDDSDHEISGLSVSVELLESD